MKVAIINSHLKSIADLRKHSTKETPEDLELHKPYVDEVQVCCEKCGSKMNRTPEVIDVWFDSGSMPFGAISLSV